MNLSRLLTTFAASLFFLCLGILCMILPWWTEAKLRVLNFIQFNTWSLFFLGFGLFLVGLGAFASILLSPRKRYYTIQNRIGPVSIDQSIVQSYLSTYLRELFGQEVPCTAAAAGKSLHITADLPFIEETKQHAMLTRIHADLEQMFGKVMKFDGEILLSASFQPETAHTS